MAVSITVTGVDDVKKYLKDKRFTVNNVISKSMQEIDALMINEIQNSIQGNKSEPKSVDTGAFLNSIFGEATSTSASVNSSVEYAKYLEFGTSKIEARSHFRNSFNRRLKDCQNILDNAIKKACG